MSHHSSLPVFSSEKLIAPLGGDADLARIVLESGRNDLSGYFGAIDAACAGGATPEAQRIVHTLKGLVAQMGAPRLGQLLIDANQRLKSGEALDADTLALLHDEYRQLLTVLDEWLKRG